MSKKGKTGPSASAMAILVGALTTLSANTTVRAGGGADKLMLVIDPTSKESMYLGNYYKQARNIPDSNVLYLVPSAFDYADFVNIQQRAVLGTIDQRGLGHIDYILVAPVDDFWIAASGLVTDNCSPVTRFSIPAAFSGLYISDEILGGVQVGTPNRYAGVDDAAYAFDSATSWFSGRPSNQQGAERYFIGTQLGYLGERGNSVEDIIELIDRSVAIDGARPAGTFYFQTTNDSARSGPRDGRFDAAVATIQSLGGQAENNCCNPLPIGEHDCLGIMTGAATLDILSGDFSLISGAFADHLTSWAATFDRPAQTKISEWIIKGASGTYGTIEEPCNYAQKFPHPRLHVYYYQGLSMGEAAFRSLAWFPFQGMIYGDPLTRPFAYLPEVTVRDAPNGAARGVIELTPRGQTAHPNARMDEYELFVDGRSITTIDGGGQSFRLDTRRFADGVHEVRVVGYDDSLARSQGEWVEYIRFNNYRVTGSLSVTPTSGDLSTFFAITVDGEGGDVAEARVFANGRVIAATTETQFPMIVYGATLGGGQVALVAEVEFVDGRIARSIPRTVNVNFDVGSPGATDPIAYSYTKMALSDTPTLIELPATFDDADETLTFDIISPPAQAELLGRSSRPYRLLVPDQGATGVDQFTWRVRSSTGESDVETVTVVYDKCGERPMTLSVGPLVGGRTGEFVVTCGAPNEQTWLGYSVTGIGSTYVPQLGVSLDLAQPQLADAPKQTNQNGMVRWRLDLPNPRRPVLVWLQAAQIGMKSNIVATQIE